MVRTAILLIIVCLMAVPSMSDVACAQSEKGAAAAQSNSQGGSFQLTEEKLQSFVAVAVRIGRMKRIWEPRISRAKTRAEATKFQDAAIEQMLAMIEGAPGITVDEYMGIAQAAQTDDALARVIADMIEEASSP